MILVVQGSETATYTPKFFLIPYSDSTGREASEYTVLVISDTALNHKCDVAEVATIFTIFAISATDFQSYGNVEFKIFVLDGSLFV